MQSLPKEEIETIIKRLKTKTFFDSQKKLKDLIDRLGRLRRNLLIAAGTVSTFLAAGISVESIGLGFVKGSVENPIVIPIALVSVFLYYLYLYSIHYKDLNNRLNLRISLKYAFRKEVASQTAILRVRNKYGENLLSSFKETNSDDQIELLFDLRSPAVITGERRMVFNPDNKKLQEELIQLNGFIRDEEGVKFQYSLSEKEEKIFEREVPFSRKMNAINRMDFRFPFYFSWVTIGVILFKVVEAILLEFFKN